MADDATPDDKATERLAKSFRDLSRKLGGITLESVTLRNEVKRHVRRAEAAEATELVRESAAGPAGFGLDEVSAPTAVAAVAENDVVSAARRAAEKVDNGETSKVTAFERVSLEAIVHLTGRPPLRYTDGKVQPPPNDEGDNGRWRTFIAIARKKINDASASVGQVAIAREARPRQHVGTAWRLGDDLIVTNRHVAFEFVRDNTIAPPEWALDPRRPVIVDFNVTDAATTARRFPAAELVYCAPEAHVDVAILRLDKSAGALPAPLPLDFEAGSVGRELSVAGSPEFRGEEVYVVGHPFRAIASQQSLTVFGKADGFKRCSPGLVTVLPNDPPMSFEHDCSTLGGNSGSCVLSVSRHRVVGVHYGGADVEVATSMGRANLALALARLGQHRLATIFRQGRV
ncbi:MAG TPA: serine protease [Thermoanaerobaculia bacterium]|jgi:hypothetical protein